MDWGFENNDRDHLWSWLSWKVFHISCPPYWMNHFLGQFCKDSPQWHSSYSKILLNNLFEVFFVGLVNDDIHNILVLYHLHETILVVEFRSSLMLNNGWSIDPWSLINDKSVHFITPLIMMCSFSNVCCLGKVIHGNKWWGYSWEFGISDDLKHGLISINISSIPFINFSGGILRIFLIVVICNSLNAWSWFDLYVGNKDNPYIFTFFLGDPYFVFQDIHDLWSK